MKDHRKLKKSLKEKGDLLPGEQRMLFGDKFQQLSGTVFQNYKIECFTLGMLH